MADLEINHKKIGKKIVLQFVEYLDAESNSSKLKYNPNELEYNIRDNLLDKWFFDVLFRENQINIISMEITDVTERVFKSNDFQKRLNTYAYNLLRFLNYLSSIIEIPVDDISGRRLYKRRFLYDCQRKENKNKHKKDNSCVNIQGNMSKKEKYYEEIYERFKDMGLRENHIPKNTNYVSAVPICAPVVHTLGPKHNKKDECVCVCVNDKQNNKSQKKSECRECTKKKNLYCIQEKKEWKLDCEMCKNECEERVYFIECDKKPVKTKISCKGRIVELESESSESESEC